MTNYKLVNSVPALKYDEDDPSAVVEFVNGLDIDQDIKDKLTYLNEDKKIYGVTALPFADTDWIVFEDATTIKRYTNVDFLAKYVSV